MRILIICTGNTCRSQMAEAFIKKFAPDFEVYSAGTMAEEKINPLTVQVMKEVGIDISNNVPKQVDIFTKENFDYVITVCDGAKEICPVFTGNVKKRLHIGFEDPAGIPGTLEYRLSQYRRIRDEIKTRFKEFVETISR